jgi:hypothetical protein
LNIGDLKMVQTRGGNKYYITFIDDCIRYYYTYLLRRKDDAPEMFKHHKNKVENQPKNKIKVIRSDKDREYKILFDKCYS